MPHYAHGRPKNHCEKPDEHTDETRRVCDDFDQLASCCEKNRGCYQPDEQRKFSPDRAAESLCVLRLMKLQRFFRHAPGAYRLRANDAIKRYEGFIYPPAMAPMIRNGSVPFAICSGSGASGDSWDKSSPQAKNRTIGRRSCVT